MVPQDTWLLRLRAHVVQPAAGNKAVQQHMHQWSDSTRRYLQAVGVHTASQDVPDRRVHAVPHVPLPKTTPKARLFCQLAGFVVDVYVRRVAVHAPLCHQSMIKPQYNTIQNKAQNKAQRAAVTWVPGNLSWCSSGSLSRLVLPFILTEKVPINSSCGFCSTPGRSSTRDFLRASSRVVAILHEMAKSERERESEAAHTRMTVQEGHDGSSRS